MEREIISRGKRLDNGEWVYGLFWKDLWGNGESCFILCDGMDIEIEPATRGQYTGLTDKNGVKIFEGDIVQDFDGEIYEVAYRGCQFSRKTPECGFLHFFDWGKSHDVIGNIHDDPELLEVQNEDKAD